MPFEKESQKLEERKKDREDPRQEEDLDKSPAVSKGAKVCRWLVLTVVILVRNHYVKPEVFVLFFFFCKKKIFFFIFLQVLSRVTNICGLKIV